MDEEKNEKITVVKPSEPIVQPFLAEGGMHPPYAPVMFRRVVPRTDAVAKFFEDHPELGTPKRFSEMTDEEALAFDAPAIPEEEKDDVGD